MQLDNNIKLWRPQRGGEVGDLMWNLFLLSEKHMAKLTINRTFLPLLLHVIEDTIQSTLSIMPCAPSGLVIESRCLAPVCTIQ